MGTFIKINSADFSNSPFGKVTTTEALIDNIVSAYTTAIGDTTYQTELRILVKSLYDNGIWEGLDIYPMLGNTLAKKCVNLNSDNGTLKAPLLVGGNASSVSDYIQFTKATDAGDLSAETYIGNKVMNGFYVAADYVRSESGASNYLYSTYTGHTCILGSIGSIGADNASFFIESSITDLAVPITSRKLISGNIFQGESESVAKNDVYADSVKVGERTTTKDVRTTTNYNPGITNRLGAKSGAVSSVPQNLFAGNCWFFAIGFVDHSKRELLDTIFKTFLDAVKPRA